MPEKKKYVTLDQLQRFYKRITKDDSVAKIPIATFDGIDYYDSQEWNSSSEAYVNLYDYQLRLIATIWENDLTNYTGDHTFLRGDGNPPSGTVFMLEGYEFNSSPVIALYTSQGPITSTGVYTINNINYYIEGDFQSFEDDPSLATHITIYVGALPKGDLVSYTARPSDDIIVDDYNTPVYASQAEAYLDLHLMPLGRSRLGILSIDVQNTTLFQSSDYCNIFKESGYDSNLVDPEQNLASQLLQYYLSELFPYRIKCFIHSAANDGIYFTTILEQNSEVWRDLNHIDKYDFVVWDNGVIDTNLVIATDPQNISENPEKVTLDICCVNNENNTTALVLSDGITPVLLPIDQNLVIQVPDVNKMVTWQFVLDHGWPVVTASVSEISNTENDAVFNIAPTVTIIRSGVQDTDPLIMPANLKQIFSDDGWELQELWTVGEAAFGITRVDGCCELEPSLQSPKRYKRIVNIWGPCTIYCSLYNPWAL